MFTNLEALFSSFSHIHSQERDTKNKQERKYIPKNEFKSKNVDWSSTRSTNGLIMEEERVSVMAGWAALSAKEKRGKKIGEIFF